MCVACNRKDGIHRKGRKVPVVIVRDCIESFMKYTSNKFSFGQEAGMLEVVMGRF